MQRRRLLPGPVLMGFATLFDAAWGNPCPPGGIPAVTPTIVGGAALPFPCPHCGAAVLQAAGASSMRRAYHDPVRGFSWCPACGGRYRIDAAGAPPGRAIEAGAAAAPCRVRLGGVSWILDMNSLADDLDFLETT